MTSSSRYSKRLTVTLALTAIVLVISILGPVLAPHNPEEMFGRYRLSPPSADFVLGTDHLGRDILSRLLYGAKTSITVAGFAVLISMLIGVPLGIMAAYYKRIDNILMRIIDILFSFPPVLLAIFIVAVLGPGTINAMIAIAITYIPRYARVIRGEALVIVEMEYIKAARSIGVSTPGIFARHILPNVAGILIVQLSLNFATAILAESSLSFLGLGVQPPLPAWGSMLDQGRVYLEIAPWASFFPGLAIFITVLVFNLCGDAIRDHLDPRLRGAL